MFVTRNITKKHITTYTKALVAHERDDKSIDLSVQSIELPQFNQDSILVRVQHVSINSLDLMQLQGYAHRLLPVGQSNNQSENPSLAHSILGRDAVGVIERVGSNVWNFAKNQRVWISRDPLGSGTFAERIHVNERELSLAPSLQKMSTRSMAALPFATTTAWKAIVDCARITPPPIASIRDHRVRSINQTVLIHGAGGPLGTLAARMLTNWGYNVIATVLRGQQTDALVECGARVIEARPEDDEIINKSVDNSTLFSSPPRAVPRWATDIDRSSISVFIDGVGGAAPEAAAAALLQPGGAFCTLRGPIVKLIDEHGLLNGSARAASNLAASKARFAAIGASYHWVLNSPNAKALDYVRSMINQSAKLEVPLDEAVFSGLEGIQAAIDYCKQNKPQYKVVVNIGD